MYKLWRCAPTNLPLNITNGIGIVPFGAFTQYTPVIPDFYRDVYSLEERDKHICKTLSKLECYVNYLADNINAGSSVLPTTDFNVHDKFRYSPDCYTVKDRYITDRPIRGSQASAAWEANCTKYWAVYELDFPSKGGMAHLVIRNMDTHEHLATLDYDFTHGAFLTYYKGRLMCNNYDQLIFVNVDDPAHPFIEKTLTVPDTYHSPFNNAWNHFLWGARGEILMMEVYASPNSIKLYEVEDNTLRIKKTIGEFFLPEGLNYQTSTYQAFVVKDNFLYGAYSTDECLVQWDLTKPNSTCFVRVLPEYVYHVKLHEVEGLSFIGDRLYFSTNERTVECAYGRSYYENCKELFGYDRILGVNPVGIYEFNLNGDVQPNYIDIIGSDNGIRHFRAIVDSEEGSLWDPGSYDWRTGTKKQFALITDAINFYHSQGLEGYQFRLFIDNDYYSSPSILEDNVYIVFRKKTSKLAPMIVKSNMVMFDSRDYITIPEDDETPTPVAGSFEPFPRITVGPVFNVEGATVLFNTATIPEAARDGYEYSYYFRGCTFDLHQNLITTISSFDMHDMRFVNSVVHVPAKLSNTMTHRAPFSLTSSKWEIMDANIMEKLS